MGKITRYLIRQFRAKLFDGICLEFHGKKVWFPNVSHSRILHTMVRDGQSTYEPEVFWHLQHRARPLFVDIGANIGLFTLYAAFHPQVDRVISVEPLPGNASYIRKQIQKLGLSNIRLVGAALGERDVSAVPFYHPAQKKSDQLSAIGSLQNLFASGTRLYGNRDAVTIDVPVTTLDGLLRDEVGGALIKLDAEGSEYDILLGAPQTIARTNVDWIIEILVTEKRSHEIFDIMRGAGYHAYCMTPNGPLPEPVLKLIEKPNLPARSLHRNHLFTRAGP